ncbi:MAG: 50S ribosomal protein L17 [Thermoguttaceae bacterium]|nr:50S ribosomal protein L17 [Thermoguttaceae bacterium]
MRHRNLGRKLGRNPNHQRALKRMLATSLILTEATAEDYDNYNYNVGKTGKQIRTVKPDAKIQGRIITTLPKAKEVRPMVEKLVTLAKSVIEDQKAADALDFTGDRKSDAWKAWRNSEKHAQWVAAIAPVVAARRRAYDILRDKIAVAILFDKIAPRYVERPGGYTRILKLATPRLGDSGARAILEFVGRNDGAFERNKVQAQQPVVDAE